MSQCGDLRMFAHKKKMKFISNMNLTKTTYSFMLRYVYLLPVSMGNLTFKHLNLIIKSIFDEIGLSFIWNDQIHIKKRFIKVYCKTKII
jgi:hypothetical protein